MFVHEIGFCFRFGESSPLPVVSRLDPPSCKAFFNAVAIMSMSETHLRFATIVLIAEKWQLPIIPYLDGPQAFHLALSPNTELRTYFRRQNSGGTGLFSTSL